MSDILTREQFQLACACGEDDDIIRIDRHDLTQRAEIAELKTEFAKMDLMRLAAETEVDIQDAQIAAMQEVLAKALPKLGHDLKCLTINPIDVWAEKGSWNDDACQCLIGEIRSTLSDAVERGKKLIEMERLVGALTVAWNSPESLHAQSPKCLDIIRELTALSGSRPSGEANNV